MYNKKFKKINFIRIKFINDLELTMKEGEV